MTERTPRRILAVDDDPVSLLVAQHILRTNGHTVTTATSAAEARELIVASPDQFDVVVCDYFMPEATGLDLLSQLDELDIWIPILLLTGVSDEAELGDDRSAAVAGFLTKPVQSEELLGAVESLVGVTRGSLPDR